MQAVTRGGRGTAGAPRTRHSCREDGNSAGPAGGTGGFTPGKRRDGHRGLGAAVKQVPREEGRAGGSFVEEGRDERSAGLWTPHGWGESSCLKPCPGWRAGRGKGESVCFQP